MVDSTRDLTDEQTQTQPAEDAAYSDIEQNQAGQGDKDYDTLNNQYLRLAADFDNFRKRQAQERQALFKYGAQSTLDALLPVLDNLERAKQSLNENADPKVLYKSYEMLAQQLLDTLNAVGLKKMDCKGETFDPERHEAISQVEREDVPEHSILEVYQDGYLIHDRVLRPAQVLVSVKPQDNGAVNEDETPFLPEEATRKNNPFQQPPDA